MYKHLLKPREIRYPIVIFYLLLPIIPFFKDNIDSSILEIYYCYKLISPCYKMIILELLTLNRYIQLLFERELKADPFLAIYFQIQLKWVIV